MASERGNSRLIADRYRLEAQLGRGGMGVVWRAMDELLGRQVAVKEVLLGSALLADEAQQLRERTLREARTVAQIRHPHVITVHDVVVQHGHPYIVMELIEGGSLADRLAVAGPLVPAEAARLCLALLGALRAAHTGGVLHRDLKPGNVLMESDTGRVVLTDFGIAQVAGSTTLTEHGSFVGSPEYTAPERMSGGAAGPESDLWSLGVLLCAALTGESPFRRDTLGGIVAAVLMEDLRPPAVAGPLLPVIRGLLERDPERRIDAEEAERLLRSYVETGIAPYVAPSGGAPPRHPVLGPVLGPLLPAAGNGSAAGRRPRWPRARPLGWRGGWPRGRRARAALVAGALVVALAAAAGAAAGLLLGRDGEGGGPASDSPSATRSSGPTPTVTVTREPTGAKSAPAGYRTVHDPAGFSLAVPRGYERATESRRIFYVAPGGVFRIGVKEADPVTGGPVAALRRAHREGPRSHEGYRAGEVTETTHNGRPAALWEFTWDGDGLGDGRGRRHMYDLAWEEGGRMYDVWVSAPAGRADEAKRHFDTALDTFVRTRSR
ncbi:serine/threonine-protein kinase [Streptomyces monticola]|uniref:non-specific serine/threonine protein kinase n=1 Tax=Streptomyces monticola TaxID=2666263 RepID=A0ABW2JNZ4_9ACTN